MTVDTLTGYLHRQIPLTTAMGVAVDRFDGIGLRLTAPLAANSNPHGTGFAGSQSVLGILAGWTLLFARLQTLGLTAELVIRDSCFSYRRPVHSDLWAEASVSDALFLPFAQELRTGGRPRLTLNATVGDISGPCGRHEGTFVALPVATKPLK